MNSSFTILTVSQLNIYVRSLLEGDCNLKTVYVRGEISNFTNHYRSGHYYMSLKDENAIIKAVMFKGNAQKLCFLPENGMRVIVSGCVSLYERDGQYQIYINDIVPDGAGALHVSFEQLKERLRLQGLFKESHKKPLPAYPMRIGVVTSPTGAALQDIINILKRRWPIARIILCPVLVQGDEAPSQLCSALERLNESSACDVIIFGRGGGSLEELWAFNNERVAMAIYHSKIPVVSAVGHETDYTISDFVADLRAPTPSAAAELVSPDGSVVAEYVAGLRSVMTAIVRKRIDDQRKRLQAAVSAKALSKPMYSVELQRMKLDFLLSSAVNSQLFRISQAKEAFANKAGRLDGLSPLKVISRGYAIPTHADGTIIKDIDDFNEHEEFYLRLGKGVAECEFMKEADLQKSTVGQEEK